MTLTLGYGYCLEGMEAPIWPLGLLIRILTDACLCWIFYEDLWLNHDSLKGKFVFDYINVLTFYQLEFPRG